jgi:hypothetical protein
VRERPQKEYLLMKNKFFMLGMAATLPFGLTAAGCGKHGKGEKNGARR